MTKGQMLRELRTRHKQSLAVVSAERGFTEGFLSRVECDLRPCSDEQFEKIKSAIHRIDAAQRERARIKETIAAVVAEVLAETPPRLLVGRSK